MHKLISLLSFSVVNKTVHNNRAAVYCDLKDSRCLLICMEDKQAPHVAKVIKVRLLLRCTVWVPGWAVLPESSACALCRAQCIFNEVQLPSVLRSKPLKGAASRPLPDLCFSSWIRAEELCTINNRAILRKCIFSPLLVELLFWLLEVMFCCTFHKPKTKWFNREVSQPFVTSQNTHITVVNVQFF